MGITRQQRSLLVTALLVFVGMVVLVLFGLEISLKDLRVQEEQKNLALSHALTYAYGPQIESLLKANSTTSDTFKAALHDQLATTSAVKINLFDTNSRTVYSTDATAIKKNKLDNTGLQTALTDKVVSAYETFAQETESGQLESRRVVSIYLPIYEHELKGMMPEPGVVAKVVGVFEVYSDVTPQIRGLQLTHLGLALAATVMIGLVFGGVYFFMGRSGQALQKHQTELERYALMIQQTPTILMEVNKQGQLLFLNPSAKKHFPELAGLEREAVAAHPLLASWEDITAYLQPGTTFEREVSLSEKVYLQKINYNEQSQTYDIYAYDLTQQKRSEAELLKAQGEQRAVLEAIPDMMFIASRDGVLLDYKLDANHYAEDMRGLHLTQLAFLTPKVLELYTKGLQRTLERQRTEHIEYDLVIDDVQRYYEARLVPLGLERGMALVRDITSRKKQELALRESEARIKSLLEAIPDMVFVMNREGTYLDFKLDKAHQILEDLVGRNVRELSFMSPEVVQGLLLRLELATATNEVQTFEYSLEGYFGDVRRLTHYEARFAPIDHEKVLMVVRDVSQRHTDEVALQRLTVEAQRRAQELTLLDEVRSVATKTFDLSEVIRQTVEVIANTFDYTLCSIYLLEGNELVLQHQVGYHQFIKRLPLDKGVMGKVVRTGQAVFLKTPHDDPEVVRAFTGINSEICVPLLDANRVVGVLNLESTETRFFDEADFRLMTALSETLGIAIGRSRLYQATKANEQTYRELYALSQQQAERLARRADELALLDKVRDATLNATSLQDLYHTVVEAVVHYLGYSHAFLFEVQGETFVLAHQVGYDTVTPTLPISQGICGRAVRLKEAILVADVSSDPDHVGVETDIRSGIYVPFVQGGSVKANHVKGVLCVETSKQDAVVLREADLRVLSSLTDFISMAMTRTQLYHELQTNEVRYRELIENASDIIYRIDLMGKFTYANAVVKRLIGYDENEVVGKHYLSLVRPDQRESVQAFYVNQLTEKLVTTYLEFPALNLSGEEVWIGQNVGLVYEQGRVVGMQAVARDITKRKRMEEALVRQAEELSSANADLEQFAFIAAHDLQEPLRKIQAFGDRLHLKYKDALDEQGRDYLSRMRGSATRMRTLIDDLLSFARANKQHKLELVSLESIVKGILSSMRRQLEETGAMVNVGTLPTLYVDPSQLRLVFENLLSNALKFRQLSVAPVITIASQRHFSGDWEVRVSDNGIGFDEQYKERVFAVFQRLHSREEYEGTGIGLAIVRRIIEGHGGTIEAVSRPQEGTTFCFTLPGVAKIHTEDSQGTVLA